MNKIYLFTAAFAVMASLSGCSDTELASIDTAQEKTPIGFHTVGSQMGSRATIIDNSNLTDYSFKVYAFTRNSTDGSDGTVFMGTNDAELGNKGGVNISYQGGKWGYNTPTDLKYWPTGALNFYAVSPVSDQFHYYWQITDKKKEIKVVTFDEYGDPENFPKNVDVMYAISKNQTKTEENGGKVKMKFRHILSQVAFKARTEFSSMKVTINSIKIYHFYNTGTFTLPTTDAEPTQTDWNRPDAGYITDGFIAVKDKSIDVGYTPTSISIDGPMLFIPQMLNKWTTTAESPRSIEQANADKQSYLEISCKIKQNDTYLFGNESEYKTLYVPFGADWQPGKRYVYTLVFGGGYDTDGNAILQPINFEPEVKEWVEDATTSKEIPLYQQH